MSTTPSPSTPSSSSAPKESVKETLISIIIAFVLAFVFRGFVIEAFVIPTGSMAPTLMGQHMRFTGERSGYSWQVGPWYFPSNQDRQNPTAVQRAVTVHDPMTGDLVDQENVPTRAGDRILVLKYLYALREPSRFDVVVFKNPEKSDENYIKRLVGVAGEQLALVDGDVFQRVPLAGEAPPDPVNALKAAEHWNRTDWKIARKPADVAQAVWQCVFDSSYSPTAAAGSSDFVRAFAGPWVGESAAAPGLASKDWQITGRRSYVFSGNAKGTLRWNSKGMFFSDKGPTIFRPDWPRAQAWTIDDRYPYDETGTEPYRQPFPVSDIRLRAGFEPAAAGSGQPLEVAATITARGHEFRGRVTASDAIVEMRTLPTPETPDPAWQELGRGPAAIAASGVTDVEFWHLDQSLQLWVGGHLAARGEYNWNPSERIRFATGRPLESLVDPNNSDYRNGLGLATPRAYLAPSAQWQVSGKATMHRVGLDRDLHYRAESSTSHAWATHPCTTMTLSKDEFFVCGDNSPQSKDGRLWGRPEPWVETMIDGKPGVVPRRLMLGKAFFVYFPALAGSSPIPMPDFGSLRFIR